MATLRQNKVARLIQKEIGIMFQGSSNFTVPGVLVTVTTVRISPDLGFAKVYISLFPNNKVDEAFELIKSRTSEVRGELGKKVRHQLRIVPEVAFYIDDSLNYVERIDELLKQ